MSKEDQMIACFPAVALDGKDAVGCMAVSARADVMDAIFSHAVFRRRGDIESNSQWLQIIPYVIIQNHAGNYLTYRRRETSGEVRLHGKVSIGVGGHVEQTDNRVSPQAAVLAAAYRELHEELQFDPPLGPSATLYQSSFLRLQETPVDRVHFGIVMSLGYSGTIQPNDDEVEVIGWLKPAAILKLPEVEEWTKSLLTYWQKRSRKGCNC